MGKQNLKLWDQFADIDPKFTKPIKGKPYKGTSPNPHYVIRCLTEMFGPVGEGFGWEVLAEGFQPMGEELLHWCRIRFWHGEGKGFDAYGQTKAVMKTHSGFMSDEDAPKKSLTDAITKAAAQVGVASNIFLGRWDDNKYVAEVNQEYRAAEQREEAKDPAPQRTTNNPQTQEELGEVLDWAAVSADLIIQINKAAQGPVLGDIKASDQYQTFKSRAPRDLVSQVVAALKQRAEDLQQAGNARAA